MIPVRDLVRRSGCGHLLIALRVDALLDRQDFDRRLEDLIQITKAVPLAPGVEEIFYPGELEDRNAWSAERTGIDLPAKTRRDLGRPARECGIDDAAEILGPAREAGR